MDRVTSGADEPEGCEDDDGHECREERDDLKCERDGQW